MAGPWEGADADDAALRDESGRAPSRATGRDTARRIRDPALFREPLSRDDSAEAAEAPEVSALRKAAVIGSEGNRSLFTAEGSMRKLFAALAVLAVAGCQPMGPEVVDAPDPVQELLALMGTVYEPGTGIEERVAGRARDAG